MRDPASLAKEYLEHEECSADTCSVIHEATPYSDAITLARAYLQAIEREGALYVALLKIHAREHNDIAIDAMTARVDRDEQDYS
jgi:hypothetical protein